MYCSKKVLQHINAQKNFTTHFNYDICFVADAIYIKLQDFEKVFR